jgi:transmembrane sensor
VNPQTQEEHMTVQEQAAWWVTELLGASTGAEARFAAWLKQSPRNVEEFLLFNALWRELDGVDPERRIDVEALVAEARATHAASKIVPLHAEKPVRKEPRAGRFPRWRFAAAFAILAVVTPLIWLAVVSAFGGTRTYTSAIGEQRAVKLADGSVVHLNTATRIEVDYSDHGRDIRLIDGEALFSVRRDTARPFRVRAGDTIVQAVGTEFNVYRRLQATTVSVVEGAVQVGSDSLLSRTADPAQLLRAPTRLESYHRSSARVRVAAGEQVDVVSGGEIVKHAAADIDKAIAWRSRRLIFRSEPLANVAVEFNRYNDLEIRVDGEAVRSRRLIGTFDSDDPESLVRFLATEDDLEVKRAGRMIIIQARDSGPRTYR